LYVDGYNKFRGGFFMKKSIVAMALLAIFLLAAGCGGSIPLVINLPDIFDTGGSGGGGDSGGGNSGSGGSYPQGGGFWGGPTLDKLKFEISGNSVRVSAADYNISGDVVIPETYENRPVSSIPSNAFRNCTYITSILIPPSITYIGTYALAGCQNLTTVTFGGSSATTYSSSFDGDLRARWQDGGAGTYQRNGNNWTKIR
jgi:hypothetical protein